MKGIVSGALFLGAYLGVVTIIVAAHAIWGNWLSDAVFGIDAFVVAFLPVFAIAAICGAVGVSFSGLSLASRCGLGVTFLIIIGASFELTLDLPSNHSWEVPGGVVIAAVLVWNVLLGYGFVRFALRQSEASRAAA